MSENIAFWYSGLEGHACGYCKSEEGCISQGMWAKTLSADGYQNLIDRGFRRSGYYCYKPLMNMTCCPMYTIKCNALKFQLSKSQKRVIKRFNKFLKDGVISKPDTEQNQDDCNPTQMTDFEFVEAPEELHRLENIDFPDETDDSTSGNITPSTSQSLQVAESKKMDVVEATVKPKQGLGANPKKPPCKKAKVLRMERRKQKLLKRGHNLETANVGKGNSGPKTLEDLLGEAPQDGKHKFRIELVNVNSSLWKKYRFLEFELYKKYQTIIHNDEDDKFEGDESFQRFLVQSPLQSARVKGNVSFGSFHQLYWLDDKLIAVGVIDILPKCVSAVYFFYDPDYRHLVLGTYGSLQEIAFARSLHQTIPTLEYYYMGFYIHSCPKMKYKGKLAPSFLMCPETYNWFPLEKCLPKLDVAKYCRLDEDQTSVDEDACSPVDVDRMKTVDGRQCVLFKDFSEKSGREELFKTIGNLIGRKCAKSFIIIGDHFK